MKIYELRSCSFSQVEAELDEKRERGIENLGDVILAPSAIFTDFERAKAAANEQNEEEHIACLSQEEIDSEELLNVCDDLTWVHETALDVWSAHNENTGMRWLIYTHRIAD